MLQHQPTGAADYRRVRPKNASPRLG